MEPSIDRRQVAKAWVLVLAWGLLCVAMLGALGGWHDQGLGPYLRAVGSATHSTMRLAIYVAVILVYSVSLEWGLRQLVQRRIEAMPWALTIPALIYGATHGIYHVAGVVYATALGVGTAWLFRRVRDWRVNAAWHAQWNLIAIGGTISLAILAPGPIRDHVLWAYKDAQIQGGTLAWAPGFGWVDLLHRDVERFDHVLNGLERGGRTFTLVGQAMSMWGTRYPVRRTFTVTAPVETESDRLAVACRLTWELSRDVEQMQDDLDVWSGMALSAYQADDLPAVVHVCMERAGHAYPIVRDVEALRARWADEGMAQLAVQVRTLTLGPWATPSKPAQAFLSKVEGVRFEEAVKEE